MIPAGTAGREWDHVVVGAGSAGVVVATRLAARGRRVLLLEAGPDPAVGPGHPLADAGRLVLEGWNWDHEVNLRAGTARDDLLAGRPVGGPRRRALWSRFPYRLGRVVGGSSAVNGALALRALPRDIEDWVAAGNPDWSWEHVLPFYRRIEDDADFPGGVHGTGGPIPIRRPRPDEMAPLDVSFRDYCAERGVPDLPDLNDGREEGVGPIPTNTVDGRRVSVAEAYLADARRRPGLCVRAGVTVSEIVVEHGRAVGVALAGERGREVVRAGDVVLCAGAIGTPAVLLRSGIGHAAVCAAAGITPRVDLPGVGENLVDHASVVVWAAPKPGVARPRPTWRQVMARLSSGVGDRADVSVGMLTGVGTATIPRFADRTAESLLVGVSVMLMRPESRGRVLVADAAPASPPVVELGLGDVEADVARLAGGVRTAWDVLSRPCVAERLEGVRLWTARMIGDDDLLRAGVRQTMAPAWHPAGTARMGPASDPDAVVDQDCRVHGVAGLRVVDASVFPTIPGTPTNLTTIMLAERIAAEGRPA